MAATQYRIDTGYGIATTTDALTADRYSRMGCRVTARANWRRSQ